MMMTTWSTSRAGADGAGLAGKSFVGSWLQPISAKIKEICAIKNRFKLNLIHDFFTVFFRAKFSALAPPSFDTRGEQGCAGIRGRAVAPRRSPALTPIQKRLACVS
jgi:hypothetical protein